MEGGGGGAGGMRHFGPGQLASYRVKIPRPG